MRVLWFLALIAVAAKAQDLMAVGRAVKSGAVRRLRMFSFSSFGRPDMVGMGLVLC